VWADERKTDIGRATSYYHLAYLDFTAVTISEIVLRASRSQETFGRF